MITACKNIYNQELRSELAKTNKTKIPVILLTKLPLSPDKNIVAINDRIRYRNIRKER